MPDPRYKNYCCDLRKKILVAIVGIVHEDTCGVSDAILMGPTHALTESGKAVLKARFCSWCGEPIKYENTTTVEMDSEPEIFPGDEWKHQE